MAKTRNPDFVRTRFCVELFDGNGDKFFFHSVTPIGPVVTRATEIAEEEWREAELALDAALDWWRRNRPKGSAKIVPFADFDPERSH